MTLRPGKDSTKFIGTEGWNRIWREDWDAEPKSLLKETLGLFRLHGAQLSFDPEKMDRESRMVQDRNGGRTRLGWLRGRLLSLRLNARNPAWLYAKKTGRIKFTA